MNAHEFLKGQHREILSMYSELQEASGPGKEEIGKDILTSLTVHAEIEEELYYPKLVDIGETELVEEHKAEHMSAKTLIARLMTMDADSEEYDATMKALMEQIEHHVKEEEEESMPKLEHALTERELEVLGMKLEERAEELHESTLKRVWAVLT